MDIASRQPTLTLQWCHILVLLGYEDSEFWPTVMLSNRPYLEESDRRNGYTTFDDSLLAKTTNCAHEIVRRGSLVLYCDSVCEHLNDAEKMSWVIVNHVSDIILLSSEPPVQDFVSAIHRSKAASGLFIQAISARCYTLKPAMLKRILHCVESIHPGQYGPLLVLLMEKFLYTPQVAISRRCETLACRKAEALLIMPSEEASVQLSAGELDRLQAALIGSNLGKRYGQLVGLLQRLQDTLHLSSNTTSVHRDKHANPLASNEDMSSWLRPMVVDKELFESFLRHSCYQRPVNSQLCAQLLQHVDYSVMQSIIMSKDFNVTILKDCLQLGLNRTINTVIKDQNKPNAVASPIIPDSTSVAAATHDTDLLFKAASICTFRCINTITNVLPLPHVRTGQFLQHREYADKMDELLGDQFWRQRLVELGKALGHYLEACQELPWKPQLPSDSVKDVCRFIVLGMELLIWQLEHNCLPTVQCQYTFIQLLCLGLQLPAVEALLTHTDQVTWVCLIIGTIHQLLSSYLVTPGEKLVKLPCLESQDDLIGIQFDDMQQAIRACDQISELIHCLKVHLSPQNLHCQLPGMLVTPLRNCIIGLARLPVVNSYARTPPMVWQMGWMPSPLGHLKTKLPPVPLDYLQEKEVLKEFLYRINTIGWTSRQQFEETWMGLLGVLNQGLQPVNKDHPLTPEEEIDRTQCMVLATRGVTSLLLQSSLSPTSGNPCSSQLVPVSRDKPLAFLHTRVGRKLGKVRCMIETELKRMITAWWTGKDKKLRNNMRQHEIEAVTYLYVYCMERSPQDWHYGHGQLALENIWTLIGMLTTIADNVSSGSDSTPDATPFTPTSPERTIVPPFQQKMGLLHPVVKRSSIEQGLDVHSCLQLLLDICTQLCLPESNTALMLLNETIRSMVVLSDVFTDRRQYDWLLNTLLDVYKNQPLEDELTVQYVVLGVCKAGAVVGMDVAKSERLVKIVETHLSSTHLPTKLATLYGALFLLESDMPELTRPILPHLTVYLSRTLSSISSNTILSQHHVMVMAACAFYICENYSEELKDQDFTAKIIQVVGVVVGSRPDTVSLPVYQTLMRGLERLVLADVTSQQDVDTVVKLAVDNIALTCPQRSLTAQGLLLTCMYSGKQSDQWTPTILLENPDFSDDIILQDPESLIVAMERVNTIFTRLRRGSPQEVQVMAQVLPLFLTDFFPPQDMMNKVIGEFLSSQQPHPAIMAQVVFRVFEALLSRHQHGVVKDWVLLSLSNFTQRTPIAMAIWSLTCFFTSASSNQWLRALFPYMLSRMGRVAEEDHNLFCLAGLDFYQSIVKDKSQRQTFNGSFHTVAHLSETFSRFVTLCESHN